jgi:hypothetical protein
VTGVTLVLACMAIVLIIGVVRRKPGRAVTDLAIMVFAFGMLTVIDVVLNQFMDTGSAAMSVAIAISALFALDWSYGLMAPERQRQRDRRLRELMQRRRA